LVLPLVLQRRLDPRTGVRRQRGRAGHRVGLQRQNPAMAEDLVLVALARLQTRNEQLPDARRIAQAHGMAAPVPAVEVAHHRDPPCVRRPERETHASDAIDTDALGAQAVAQIAMIALAEQVGVHLTQQWTEAVGIFGFLLTAGPADA